MHLTPHFLYDVNIAWGPEWACCFLLLDTTLTLSTWKGHLYQGFLEHAAEIRACYHKGHRKGSVNPVATHLIVAQRSAHIDPTRPLSSTASASIEYGILTRPLSHRLLDISLGYVHPFPQDLYEPGPQRPRLPS